MKNITLKLFKALWVAFIVIAISLNVAGAKEERSLEQRIADLEARISFLEDCLENVCGNPLDQNISLSTVDTIKKTETSTIPTIVPTTQTSTVIPTVVAPSPTSVNTPIPTIIYPTPSIDPTINPTATPKNCNQGRGNGSEGCDPGNSNNHNPSNDENPNNRGGKNVPK